MLSSTSSQHMCVLTTMESHQEPTCLFHQSIPRNVENQFTWTPASSSSNEDLIANILLQPYLARKPLTTNSGSPSPFYLGSPAILNPPDLVEGSTRNGSSPHPADKFWMPDDIEATSRTTFFNEAPTWQPAQSNPISTQESEPMSNWLTATYADFGTPNLQQEPTRVLWPPHDWTESYLVAAREDRPLQTSVDTQRDINQVDSFGYTSVTKSSKSYMEPHSLPLQDTFEDLNEIFVFGCTAQNDYQFEPSPISPNAYLSLPPIEEQSSDYEPLLNQPSTDSELLKMPPLSSPDPSSFPMQKLDMSQLSHPYGFISTAMSDDTQCLGSTEVRPTLADHIITFDLKPQSSPLKRKRSAFSLEGKKKVRSVRQNGACISCRARKVSCSVKKVCEACLRLVGDPLLAGQICMRDKLKDTFIGFEDFHGSLTARKANLQPLLESLIGPSKHITLSVFPGHAKKHGVAELPLKVMRCSFSPRCCWKRLREVKEIYITCEVVENERYVVIPNSLPTVDELDNFGRKALSMSEGSHSGRMTALLDDFLLLYCQNMSYDWSKVQRLSHLTLRIASLNNLVAYGFLNLRDGSFDLLELPLKDGTSERFVCKTIHDQIRLIAAEGLQSVERLIFSEIDNLNAVIRTHAHARIVVGICLLRLMLLYRDRLIRDEIRLELPGRKKLHQHRMEKAEVMYRRLTIAYSTLCNSSNTPLTTDWEDGLECSTSEGHEMLHNAFLQLQPEFLKFCNERLTQNHDNVLVTLIAGPPKDHRRTKRRNNSNPAR